MSAETRNDLIRGNLVNAWNGISFRSWNPWQAYEFLRQTIADAIDGIDVQGLSVETRESIHKTIEQAFDDVIRKTDWPLVSEPFETIGENWLWDWLCPWLDAVLKIDHE